MARDLTERDSALLWSGSPGMRAVSARDRGMRSTRCFRPSRTIFERCISERSDEDRAYLARLMERGEESLGCMPEEDVEAVLGQISRRVSPDSADRIRRLRDLIECGVLQATGSNRNA